MNTAYVINLDRRTDRWERAQQLWSPFFNLVRVSAVETTGNGARGCKESHVMIADKYLRDSEMIIVLEDDSVPSPAFEVYGARIIDEAIKHLLSWDYINLGPFIDLSVIGMPCAVLSKTDSSLFLRTDYSHNTHFVLYNQRSLPILNQSLHSPLPVDMFLGKHAASQWVPLKVMAVQDRSPSDIRKPFEGQWEWFTLSEQLIERFVKHEAMAGTRSEKAPTIP